MTPNKPVLDGLDLDGRLATDVPEPGPKDLRWAVFALTRLLRTCRMDAAKRRYQTMLEAASESVLRTEALIRATQHARNLRAMTGIEVAFVIADLMELRMEAYVMADEDNFSDHSCLDGFAWMDPTLHLNENTDGYQGEDLRIRRYRREPGTDGENRMAVAAEFLRARGELRMSLMWLYRPSRFEKLRDKGGDMLLETRPLRNAQRRKHPATRRAAA